MGFAKLLKTSVVALVLVSSGSMAKKAEDRAKQQDEYYRCYRDVLNKPKFAARTPEKLDEDRLGVGQAVVESCPKQLGNHRAEADKSVRKAEKMGRAMGETSLPPGMFMAFSDMALWGAVGADLEKVDGRVAALVDARVTKQAEDVIAFNAIKPSPVTSLPTGDVEMMEFYDDCLNRAAFNASLGPATNEALYAIAQKECSSVRSQLLSKQSYRRPFIESLLETNEKQAERTFPALFKRVRELRDSKPVPLPNSGTP